MAALRKSGVLRKSGALRRTFGREISRFKETLLRRGQPSEEISITVVIGGMVEWSFPL